MRGTFRHRWWNYYERALSFADGEFYEEAIVDLKEAIKKRDEDQRMARTYGMHFIDYFPHRELGIVYYLMGNLEDAQSELELSIGHYPSAKANFYVDRVRKTLIERDKKEVSPPRLTLTVKEGEFWTREDPVVISGVAEDEHYVSGITINRVPLFLEISQKRIPFKETLSLPQGTHRIDVVAKNLPGKVTRCRVIVHVDREGPIITLEELTVGQSAPGREVTIHGSVYDDAGVSGLRVNGREITIQKGVEVFFTTRLPIEKSDLELVALDRLGNQTSANINVDRTSADHKLVRLASASLDLPVIVTAGLFDKKYTQPPQITVKGLGDSQRVFLEKIYIEGKIWDESQIESLIINQKPILRHKGKSIFFSHLADLMRGENSIFIEAQDEAGNGARKEISVIREVPKALKLEERLSLTTFPFEQKGVVSEASIAFHDNLIDALVGLNRFRVVERDRLDLILQEQKLSRTELIDRGTALKLGRLIAAHSILTGSIIETRTGIEIVGRMIDTETSEILAVEDVYDEIKNLQALGILAEGMAIKFHREFPLIEGLVVQRKGNHIFTDLGEGKIKAQRRLLVYREEPIKHPVTGKILGSDNEIIGKARVNQVMPELSKAEIVDEKGDDIKPLDKVITE